MFNKILFTLLFVVFPLSAHAYIGPGVGAGAIAGAFGFVAAVFIALFAVLYYPIKRAFKGKKASSKAKQSELPKA